MKYRKVSILEIIDFCSQELEEKKFESIDISAKVRLCFELNFIILSSFQTQSYNKTWKAKLKKICCKRFCRKQDYNI
jgi:hypothetical protein